VPPPRGGIPRGISCHHVVRTRRCCAQPSPSCSHVQPIQYNTVHSCLRGPRRVTLRRRRCRRPCKGARAELGLYNTVLYTLSKTRLTRVWGQRLTLLRRRCSRPCRRGPGRSPFRPGGGGRRWAPSRPPPHAMLCADVIPLKIASGPEQGQGRESRPRRVTRRTA